MRRKISIGIGAATAAIALGMGASAALATSAGHQRADVAAAASNRHITKALARQIATAKVPQSRVIEVESDDRNDRAVWKVTLATPHGRVVVDVDKQTGKATIVRSGSGGHGDAADAAAFGSQGAAGDDRADAREDRADAREDHADAREDRGDRHDDGNRHDRNDRQDDRDAADR